MVIPNRSASEWAAEGKLPFPVAGVEDTGIDIRDYEHVVVDTQARPSQDDLRALARQCDLLILPTTPDILSLRALLLTINTLKQSKVQNFKVLMTIIPPKPNRDAEDARAMLDQMKVPVFKAGIRRFSAYQKGALAGVLVHQVGDARGKLGWNDYVAVGRELTK
jgi:chromosome partitioning protein